MPLIKSAKKALRVAARKRVFNDKRRLAMRKAMKKLKTLVDQKSKDEAKKVLGEVYQTIDKAFKIGVLKKNTAARKKSLMARMVKSLG